MRAFCALILIAGLATGCSAHAPESSGREESRAGPRIPLEIHSGSKRLILRVEIARTAAEQQKGLMFRTALGRDEGMLFPFQSPVRASFWMKNTLIPLDMIFIRADGTIARIAMRTTPLSLDPVDAGEDVAAVLEIAGGGAEALGIGTGDRVIWPSNGGEH